MAELKKPPRRSGRPEMQGDKKICFVRARLTEKEHLLLLEMEQQLGLNRTEIIRRKVLGNAAQVLVNAVEVLRQLDHIGAELGRSGNNINQLARHANILNKQGKINQMIINDFNGLFKSYMQVQQEIDRSLRILVRLIRG